jgi:hypothetical protein
MNLKSDMNQILYNIYTTQIVNGVNIDFSGNGIYYRGDTSNQTIAFRASINAAITTLGFTLPLQKQVLHWGGIHRFNQFTLVNPAVNQILQLNTINLQTANAISSYSKLFAFYSPKKYFILDARVAYVINKIIITNNLTAQLPINFNINRSRNASLILNYTTLMNGWNGGRINIKNYYPVYCNLIKQIHNYFITKNPLIFTNNGFNNNDPEIIEMFIFYLADYI